MGHVLALTAVVGFVLLGFWQLRRHEERRALDQRVAERIELTPIPFEHVLAEADRDPASIEFRQTVAAGTYLTDEEVILQARTFDGRSGHEVLTPLLLPGGTAVIVDRGWVPIDVEGPPVAGAEPPTGGVTVTGYVRTQQTRQGLGPVDPADGELDRVSRVDIDRLARQIGTTLEPVWIQLAGQEPTQAAGFPLALRPPEPGGGPPHLGYAAQWFIFAGIVVIAYPVLMRRTADRGSDRQKPRRVRVATEPEDTS